MGRGGGGSVANKPHRMTRTARTRSRKFSGHCESCGKPLCSCRAYQYTDESNGAITANAPYLCRACYETRYGVKMPTEVDRTRPACWVCWAATPTAWRTRPPANSPCA